MENIEVTSNGYKLLTSETDKEIMCPDNDVSVQAQPDGAVKLQFLKNCKVKKE